MLETLVTVLDVFFNLCLHSFPPVSSFDLLVCFISTGPVPSKAWSLVGTDCITNLPETERGNKNIYAATDHFSKWTEAVALSDKSAASVGDFLYKLILRHGCMDTLISGQGREFANQVIDHNG